LSGNPLHVRLSDLFRDRVGVLLALLVLLFPVAKGASAAVALWQYVRARQAGTAGPWPRELRTGALLILAAFVVGMIFTVDFDYTFRAFLSVVLALTFVWGVRRYAAFGDGRLQPAFLAAAVLLLLVANVASLWLTRCLRRGRELAVRSALGASSRRLALELVAEIFLLVGTAVLLGVLAVLPAALLLEERGVRLPRPALPRRPARARS